MVLQRCYLLKRCRGYFGQSHLEGSICIRRFPCVAIQTQKKDGKIDNRKNSTKMYSGSLKGVHALAISSPCG